MCQSGSTTLVFQTVWLSDWGRRNTTTCFMPYINASFQLQRLRTGLWSFLVGSVNFALLTVSRRLTFIFTTEYSIRTGMESVYTLMTLISVPGLGFLSTTSESQEQPTMLWTRKRLDKAPLSFKEKMLCSSKAVKALILSCHRTDQVCGETVETRRNPQIAGEIRRVKNDWLHAIRHVKKHKSGCTHVKCSHFYDLI